MSACALACEARDLRPALDQRVDGRDRVGERVDERGVDR